MARPEQSRLTDHVTGRLARAVDIDRWVRTQPCPWDELAELARGSGLATAAWTTLTWTHRWLGTPFPAEVEMDLRPGRLRRSYLRAWLRADPAAMYADHPTLVRSGFSLALQDSAAEKR